jgi:predicted nucleic acid-binding protein
VCSVELLSLETHDLAVDLTERYRLSFYDGVIVAAAVLAKCDILLSEDMQDGRQIEGLVVRNPFADS